MFKRNELLAFGLTVVLLLSLMTFRAFVPAGAGDLGIRAAEATHFTNLGVVEDLTVGGNASIDGSLTVSGVTGGPVNVNTLAATAAITDSGTLAIVGSSIFTGNVNLIGILSSDTINILRLNENTLVTGTLNVSGQAVLAGAALANTLSVTSTATANTLATTGAITAGGTLRSVGIAYLEAGVVTSTLNANTLSTASAITAGGTLRSVGIAYLEAGVITSTLSANTINVTNQVTVGAGLDVIGAVQITGTLDVAGVSTLAGGYTWTGLGVAGNGLEVTNNLTGTSATGILRFGVGVISSTLDAYTLNTTDGVTVGTTLDVVGALEVTGTATLRGVASLYEPIADSSGSFRINDSLIVTGSLTLDGDAQISDAQQSVRINDNLLVTGTAGVSGLLSPANGVATDRITTTAGITVGTYVGALSYYGAISSTVGITNAEVVQVTGKMIIVLTVADGNVGGGILGTLNDTNSLSDGVYAGQLLILINLDGDADTIMVKNGANTAIGKDRTLDVGDAVVLYWDLSGSVWRLVSILDTSA